MIAGTYSKELAEQQPAAAKQEKQSGRKQPFISVRLERCCLSVEISLQKEIAARAMTSTVETAVKPFRTTASAAKRALSVFRYNS